MQVWLLLGLSLIAGDPAARDIYQDPQTEDVPALVSALTDVNFRYGAALALGKVGKPAVPALLRALDDKKSDIRLWAAFALGRIGPDARQAVSALIRAVKEDDPALRAVVVEALGKIGPDAREATPALVQALKDTQPRVRSRAVVALGRIRPEGKKSIQALIDSFKDEPVRPVAIDALVQIGKPAVPSLVEALLDNDLRVDAIDALRRIDLQAAVRAKVDRTTAADIPALVRTLSNSKRNAHSRRAAAEALGELAAEAAQAIPSLTEALGDETVRQSAILALGRIGKPAVPALVTRLKDQSATTRESAALALGKVGPAARDAIPALVEVLKDRERDVRRAGCVALEAIGPDTAQAVPALARVVRSNDAEPVRQAAIKALVRARPEAKQTVVAALLMAINEGNYGVKMLAGSALRKIDPAAADKAGVR